MPATEIVLGGIEVALLAVFAGFALLSYVIPGPDWAVIVPRALDSRVAGLVTSLGVQSGLLFHAALAVGGIAVVVASNPGLLDLIRLLGGVYIVYLGVNDIRHGVAQAGISESAGEQDVADVSLVQSFARGALANILNPKAALFFVAVLPQFVPPGVDPLPATALLAAIDVTIGLVWWLVLVTACRVVQGAVGLNGGTGRATIIIGIILVGIGMLFIGRSIAQWLF